jgi:hypothetical protein
LLFRVDAVFDGNPHAEQHRRLAAANAINNSVVIIISDNPSWPQALAFRLQASGFRLQASGISLLLVHADLTSIVVLAY